MFSNKRANSEIKKFLIILTAVSRGHGDLNRTMTLTSVLGSPDIVTSCDRRSDASEDSSSKGGGKTYWGRDSKFNVL